MTNALSVTDMVLVHGAYRHYRLPLLKAGAELYEFGPRRAPADDATCCTPRSS